MSLLSETKINTALKTFVYGCNLIIHEEISSTNDFAKALAESGKPHGTVVIADSQTKGRGRLNRYFHSPKGSGLYMSIIMRPGSDIRNPRLITACAAVAAAEAAEKFIGSERIRLKWVNDLMIDGKKLCGILTESSISENGIDYIIAGIGMNISNTKSFPPELQGMVTSLDEYTLTGATDRNVLCAEVLNSFEKYAADIEKAEFMPEYRKRSCIIGKSVEVDRTVTGKAVGIGDNMQLILKLDDGTVFTVNSGEVRIID